MEDKIKSTIKRIETYKNDIQEDPILVETTLSVLKYLLTEDISDEQKKSMLSNIGNTTKIIEEKIDKIEENI
jgi:hypothetical protein